MGLIALLAVAFLPLGMVAQPSHCAFVRDAPPAQLKAVAALSADEAWAVGYRSQFAAAQFWNGSHWAAVALPPILNATSSWLFGASQIPDSHDVWAVGGSSAGTSGDTQMVAEHWDGSEWALESPNEAGDLSGVSAWSDRSVFAVGDAATNPVAGRWNGQNWSVTTVPLPAGATQGALSGVVATSADAAIAVGNYTSGSSDKLLVERFVHGSWSAMSAAARGADTLLAVATVPNSREAWAAGGGNYPAILHFDGTSWTALNVPRPKGESLTYLTGLAVRDRTHALAVGYSLDYFYRPSPVIESWNGKVWELIAGGTDRSQLSAATPVPGTSQAWAIGYQRGNSRTLRCPL